MSRMLRNVSHDLLYRVVIAGSMIINRILVSECSVLVSNEQIWEMEEQEKTWKASAKNP